MTQNNGASVPDQALAVPVEPVARLDPAGFDPSREDDAILLLAACIQADRSLKTAWNYAAWAVHSKDGRASEFMGMAAKHLAEAKRVIHAAPNLNAIATETGTAIDSEAGVVAKP